MKLLPPEVVGPLSVCSKSARIRANISGATIEVMVNGKTTASHVTTRFEGVYAIGVSLKAKDKVTVRQKLGGDKSDVGPVVSVQKVPAKLSALTLQTVLRECGRATVMTGGVPGAKVEGQIGSQIVGAGDVIAGRVGFSYKPVLAPAQTMLLKQTTCNNLSSTQITPGALPQPSPLLPPVIQEPLVECQDTITIGGVVDGAFVEMYRNGALKPEQTFTFSLSKEWRWIKPLQNLDKIEVRQGFKCKKDGPPLDSFSKKAVASVINKLGAPNILGNPCPGTTYLTISNLIPGARVVLLSDGKELGQTDAPDSTFTFTTPPLQAKAEISAHMVLCGKDGPAAKKKVGTGVQLPSAVNVSDLYECASYVCVEVLGNGSQNCLLVITNKDGDQVSAYHNIVGYRKLVPVSPSLVAGDEISVNVLGCGGSWQVFGPFGPVSAGSPPPPKLVDVVSHTHNVFVDSDHAGAIVDVFVNSQWQGSGISVGTLDYTVVYLQDELVTGDEIYGTQTLCGKASKPSKTVVVKVPRPERPELLKPANGSQDVSIGPLFEWIDPGAKQENKATSFNLVVKQGNTIVINENTPNVQHQSSVLLQHEADYDWTVDAVNSTGSSPAINGDFAFHTVEAPSPKEADLGFVPPIYSNTLNFPRNEAFSVFIDVTNSGNTASLDYFVHFDILALDNITLYDSQDVTKQPLAAGATDPAGIDTIILDTNAVRINAYLYVNNQLVDSKFRIV
jgi:hypothetical protein